MRLFDSRYKEHIMNDDIKFEPGTLRILTDLIDAGYQIGGTNFACGCSVTSWAKDGKLESRDFNFCDKHDVSGGPFDGQPVRK
jgi:hypothetical protein